MPSNSGYSVFISHATADKWLARTICRLIEATGASTFRNDRDINGGDDIPEAIWDAIDEADEFLVLMTPVSVDRPWVKLEIGAASFRGIPIVPICQHVDFDGIPDMLKRRKGFDLNAMDDYLQDLAQRVRSLR